MTHVASEMGLLADVTFQDDIIRWHKHPVKTHRVSLNRVAHTNNAQLTKPQTYQEAFEWLCPPSLRVQLAIGRVFEDMDSSIADSCSSGSEGPTKYSPQAPSVLIACALDEQIGTWSAAGSMGSGKGDKGATLSPTMIPCAGPALGKELPPPPVSDPVDDLKDYGLSGGLTNIHPGPDETTCVVLTPKSSLVSLRDSILTNETPTVHEAKVIHFKRVKGPQGAKDQLQLVANKSGSNNALSESPVAERVVMVAIGKNGSPLPRRSVRKTSRHDLRGFDALSQDEQSRVIDTEIARQAIESTRALRDSTQFLQIDDSARAGSTSPLQQDDGIRRSSKYDCGPTVRYSIDAREVIMGADNKGVSTASVRTSVVRGSTSSIKSAKSSKKTGKDDNEKGPSRQRSRNIVVHPGSSSVTPGGTRGGRSGSNLGTRGPNINTQAPKKGQIASVSRFYRPTAASAARDAVSKPSVKQVTQPSLEAGKNRSPKRPTSGLPSESKPSRPVRNSLPNSHAIAPIDKPSRGFKSRISSLLASRRRSEPVAANKPNNFSSTRNRHTSTQGISGRSVPTSVHRQSGIVSSNPPVADVGATLNRGRNQAVLPAARAPLNRPPPPTNSTRMNTSATLRPNTARISVEDPHPSPRPRRGAGAHYEETGVAATAGNADDQNIQIEAALRGAENHLNFVIQRARHVQDRAFRDQNIRLIEMLGNSVHVARELHMATIAQAQSNMKIAATIGRLTVDVANLASVRH